MDEQRGMLYFTSLEHPAQSWFLTPAQIDVVNSLQLLTAKSVTYLVNLSEKDYIRKKNKWSVSRQPF